MRFVYAIVGDSAQTIYDEEPAAPPEHHILMQSERPLEGDWTAQPDGRWKERIDDSVFINNGLVRQARIRKEEAEQARLKLNELTTLVNQLQTTGSTT